METNYFVPLRCIHAVVPEMRRRRSGCIINVTSIAGRIFTSPFGPYAPTKFRLEDLIEALAQEMKMFNVRVPECLDEFTFRLNEGSVKIHTLDRIDSLLEKSVGTRITYKQLVSSKRE